MTYQEYRIRVEVVQKISANLGGESGVVAPALLATPARLARRPDHARHHPGVMRMLRAPRMIRRFAIPVMMALCCVAAGCSRSCASPTRDSAQDSAVPLDPVEALLTNDDLDQKLQGELEGRDMTSWVVELRDPGGPSERGVRLAIAGNGRVSRWDDPSAQGTPDDTVVLPHAAILRLFTKFEKAQFAGLPPSLAGGPPDARPKTMALTREGKTVAISRAGNAEPVYAALVKLVRELGEIADVPHTDDDCPWVLRCKTKGLCKAKGSTCVAGSDEQCRATQACKAEGLCAVKDEACMAVADADCAGSSRCAAQGMCSARDGVCVATRDNDCRAAAVCKAERACVAKCGRCVKSPAEKCDTK